MMQDKPIQKVKNIVHLIQAFAGNIIYGFPARKLKIIGITGSDGKTTTSSMVYHILRANNIKTALLSTVSAKIGDDEFSTGLHVTTPDPWMIPKYLREMVDKSVEIAVIESTSNGLNQNRLWGIKFESAVITNIGVDHLDYHGTWTNYANAKFKIVRMVKKDGILALNTDHTRSAKWLKEKLNNSENKFKTKWFTKNEVTKFNETIRGISFTYNETDFEIPVLGEFNLENTLAAIKVTEDLLSLDKIAKAMSTFQMPKGRMELIKEKPISIIIDFAHTPSALEEALKTVAKVNREGGRIITVFGCAGKRDKTRRDMGKISAKYSDVTILTAEDPRNENLKDINDEIVAKAKSEKVKLLRRFANTNDYRNVKTSSIQALIKQELKKQIHPIIAFDENSTKSRQDAIDLAINIAQDKDIVFITGKAHEQSLAFGVDEVEVPWSDHEAVAKVLTELNK